MSDNLQGFNNLVDLPCPDEMLLRQIQAQLLQWKELERPLKARDVMASIPTDDLARLMAWAEISLRDYVMAKKRSIENEAVTIRPMILESGNG